MLQYPCFERCSEPTGIFVAVAPDHLARRFQLNSTSMHVCKSYIYQQTCLNQLQLTNKHICSCVAEPTGIYIYVGILTFMIMINFVLGLFKKIIYEDMLCFELLDGVFFHANKC